MSEDIFWRLFDRAISLDEGFPVDLHSRWIKRHSIDDAELMAKADVESIKLSLIDSAAIIRFDERHYFGVAGLEEPQTLPSGLKQIDITPGLFASFVVEVGLDASATAAEIRDIVEGFSSVDNDYQGHDLSDVANLFPKILFYEVNQSYVYARTIERILGSYISRGYSGGPLSFKSDTLIEIATFFENGSDWIPFSLPLRGMFSFSWDGLFLDLYRCIEQLYAVPRITRLTEKWATSESIINLAKLLEDVLSWRPKEDESLELLFRDLDVELCKDIRDGFQFVTVKESSSNPSIVASKRMYALRNSCVHFRPTTQNKKITDPQWNRIISLMLKIIGDLYHKFGRRFHQEETSIAVIS